MSDEKSRNQKIRRHAHQLAAEGLDAALNMWDLDRYYPDQAGQDQLEYELLQIIAKLRKQGGVA